MMSSIKYISLIVICLPFLRPKNHACQDNQLIGLKPSVPVTLSVLKWDSKLQNRLVSLIFSHNE